MIPKLLTYIRKILNNSERQMKTEVKSQQIKLSYPISLWTGQLIYTKNQLTDSYITQLKWSLNWINLNLYRGITYSLVWHWRDWKWILMYIVKKLALNSLILTQIRVVTKWKLISWHPILNHPKNQLGENRKYDYVALFR